MEIHLLHAWLMNHRARKIYISLISTLLFMLIFLLSQLRESPHDFHSLSEHSPSSEQETPSDVAPSKPEGGSHEEESMNLRDLLIGITFIVIPVIIFWHSEQKYFYMRKVFSTKKECHAIKSNLIDAKYEGCLVCINGILEVSEDLDDKETGLKLSKGLKLERLVEMYQYKESREDDAYKYNKIWSQDIIDSGSFAYETFRGKNEKKCHKQIKNKIICNSSAFIGQFLISEKVVLNFLELPTKIIDLLNHEESILFSSLASICNKKLKVDRHYINLTKREMGKSKLGDLRISYKYLVSPMNITILAQQKGSCLQPYRYSNIHEKKEVRMSRLKKSRTNDLEEFGDWLIPGRLEEEPEIEEKKSYLRKIQELISEEDGIFWFFKGNLTVDECYDVRLKGHQSMIQTLRVLGCFMLFMSSYLFVFPLFKIIGLFERHNEKSSIIVHLLLAIIICIFLCAFLLALVWLKHDRRSIIVIFITIAFFFCICKFF